jgi:hypothetical protein
MRDTNCSDSFQDTSEVVLDANGLRLPSVRYGGSSPLLQVSVSAFTVKHCSLFTTKDLQGSICTCNRCACASLMAWRESHDAVLPGTELSTEANRKYGEKHKSVLQFSSTS